MDVRWSIAGRVSEAETGIALPGLYVKAFDKDLLFDDLLGAATSGPGGAFAIESSSADFRDLFERRPDVYFKVYGPDRTTLLMTTTDAICWNARRGDRFEVRIPRAKLGDHAPPRGVALVDESGSRRSSFRVGESLLVHATGLRTRAPHRVEISEGGAVLVTEVLISDAHGTIPPTVIWPLAGIEDFRATRQPVAGALAGARARRISVRVLDGEKVLTESTTELAPSHGPLAVSTDRDGHALHGFVVGEHDARVSLFGLHDTEQVRVFMVHRQHDWRAGDLIRPLAVADAGVHDGRADVKVVAASQLHAGAYDFIVRRVRYGYEDGDELVVRADDVIGGRRTTGLVVREPFMPSKAIRGGCTNMLPISGRALSGSPYFQYTDVFQVGEDIYGALDPAALDPQVVGKMVAAYVIKHKTAADWSSDLSLQNLAVLGGNANAQKWLTQSFCINANERLLWPAVADVGEYDIVCDFGNNVSDPASFVPNDQYDMPLDIIDGYIVPGFRVMPDPGVDTSYAYAGTFEYDETTQGSVFVAEDNQTVPLRAVVYFPADVANATTPAQLSAAQASYPLVVLVHGNSSVTTSFRGYNYLAEHLARNGFIVASIHQNVDQNITGRARVLKAHLPVLFALFAGHVDNNIGIMGHSRGGEAVYQAAGFNVAEAWGYNFNAVISLASTAYDDPQTYTNAWAAPYLVLHGSLDEQLSGPYDIGFELYDHAATPKSLAYIYGACHARFNTEWDPTLPYSNLHPTDEARVISVAAHKAIAKGYMSAFLRQYLRDEDAWIGIFQGDWMPASVQAAVPGIRICMQYEDPTVRTVDDFEEAHTATSWQTSTIGDSVSESGLPSTPEENDLQTSDSHSPHATSGLRTTWNSLGDALQWNIQAGQRDVSGFAALSFRIGQVALSASNLANQSQDLRITLTDGAANSRAIRVSKFFEIPPQEVEVYTSYMMSAMRTVRIPLHAYTIRCVGVVEVDLTNIVSVKFEFSEIATGEVAIDSVQFTN
jgi:dienelactone hydrolase